MTKLRSDSFNHMRLEPVDVTRYLPQWLNREPQISDIQGALNIEHEAYRLKLVDVNRQFFIETATWSLADWEKLLKITPSKAASEELRRAVIRVKRRGDTVMTVENARRLLEDFAPRGTVDLRELGDNRLELIIHNGSFYWDELMVALMEQLPAHLAFNFEINRTLNHTHNVGLLTLEQGNVDTDINHRTANSQRFAVINSDITSGEQTVGIADNIKTVNRQANRAGIVELVSGNVTFSADMSEPDDFTVEDFERYLRERWSRFATNPVIKYYRHGGHSDEGEIDDPDNPPDEEFPIDVDFLRLYWKFPYLSRKGEAKYHVRYQTIYSPRDDITGRDVKAVGELAAAGEVLIYRKDEPIVTDGIIRGLYIRKTTTKII